MLTKPAPSDMRLPGGRGPDLRGDRDRQFCATDKPRPRRVHSRLPFGGERYRSVQPQGAHETALTSDEGGPTLAL